MQSDKGPDKSTGDEFTPQSELERQAVLDRLSTGMQSDREQGKEISYESHGDNIYEIIKEGTTSRRRSAWLNAIMKRYPGLVVGGTIGLAINAVLPNDFVIGPFGVIIFFALVGEILARLLQNIGARIGIEFPSVSFKNFPGAAIGGAIGIIIGFFLHNSMFGPLVLFVCGAIIGEIFYRLLKYAMPD